MDTLGCRIRHVRGLLDLSQEAFAKRLSSGPRKLRVSRGAVGNWELDQGIKTENLMLIADTFGVSVEWLARREGRDPQNLSDLARRGDATPARVDEQGGKSAEPPSGDKSPRLPMSKHEGEDTIGPTVEFAPVGTGFDDLLRLLHALSSEEVGRARVILNAAFPEKVAFLAGRNGKRSNSGQGSGARTP